ncbi:transporter substrate-binding domain-containing protein [Desulfurispirillum indicum]|uniref:transporter substrate-binding domain-containing protein n=1 Tax=Desulfurispirillum indicum TaxID=936456 RepID=UPI001CFB17D4|nr:transporter substrate-binding domain-containing protein [Desulfurispirillum indicum]UCZ56121.1 transporter substrate-binding domain-containing protein [Desulfurispirillum indicum]
MQIRGLYFHTLLPFFCALLLYGGVFSVNAHSAVHLSDDERDFLAQRQEVVFVSQTNYPPFEFSDDYGTRNGMMIELARWISAEIGFHARFLDMEFLEAQQAVLSGEADVLTSFFYSALRDETFDFTQTIFEVPASIFIAADRPDIRGLRDLHGKRIAMQRGDYAAEFLQQQNIDFEIVPTGSFAEAAEAVIRGRADAVIGDEQIVLYHLYRHNLYDRMKIVGEPLYIGLNSMAVKNGNAMLQSILNKGIDHAFSSGMLDRLNQKWLGTSIPGRSINWIELWPYALALLGGIALVVLWNVQLQRVVASQTAQLRRNEQHLTATIDELRESQAHNQALLAAMPDMIFTLDEQGVFLDFHATDLAGPQLMPSRQFLGRPVTEILPPEAARQTMEAIAGIGNGERLHLFHYQLKISGQLSFFECRLVPCEPGHFLALVRDITESKRAKDELEQVLRRQEDQIAEAVQTVRQQERMLFEQSRRHSLLNLMVNLAHQWRQPLYIASLTLDEIEILFQEGELTAEILTERIRAGQQEIFRLSETISQFTELYQSNDIERSAFALSSLCDQAAHFLSSEGSRKLQIHNQIDPALIVTVNRNDLIEIFVELLRNAVSTMGERNIRDGAITIAATVDGQNVQVCLEDTLGGIDQQILPQLFDPYVTTSFRSRDKGMGLYVVRRIVEDSYNGEISAENTENGARFRIILRGVRQ